MKKTLTAIGNSLGLIIDKPILELLNIDKDTVLEVRTDGEGLIIRPMRGEAHAEGTSPARPATSPASPAAATASRGGRRTGGTGSAAAAGRGDAFVVVELRGDEVVRVPLAQEDMIIGREAKSADIHLDDRALSRKHARIEKRGAAIWVSDLGSANGTFVNGERLTAPRRLHGGDVIGVGHYQVRISGVAEAKTDTPVLTLTGPEGLHRFAMVGEQIVIGRALSCDISIGHKGISRQHVRIAKDGDGFVVEDLGSQNGCQLNGVALTGVAPFHRGDRLQMCDFTLELGFLAEEPASDAEPSSKRPRTMLIDASHMAQAAYVEGELEKLRSSPGHMALGDDDGENTGRNRVDTERQNGPSSVLPKPAETSVSRSGPKKRR